MPKLGEIATSPWKSIRWGVALLLSGVSAWLSIRQVRWTTLWESLSHPNTRMLALALASVLATTAIKAVRWQVLLRASDAQIGVIKVLRVLLIGQMGNSFLPFRLGDVGRAAMVGPAGPGGFLAAVGTIVAEKALDGAMGLLILVGLAVWIPLPAWLRGPVLGLALLTAGGIMLLILAATQHRWIKCSYQRLVAWLPAAAQARIGQTISRLGLGLGFFRRPAHALLASALSVAIWGLAALTNTLTLAALGIPAPAWSTWLVLISGYVANLLPTVPAQIGIFEYACVLALTAARVDGEPALAFGLVLHLLVYGPPALLGSVAMAIEGISWKWLRETQPHNLEDDRGSI